MHDSLGNLQGGGGGGGGGVQGIGMICEDAKFPREFYSGMPNSL